MLLRDYIPESCIYIPLDIGARSRNCIVADLNQHQYPEQKYDVVTALFLLEYLHAPEEFLKWAYKSANELVFTYHPSHPGSEKNRRYAGFFNDFDRKEIEVIINNSGWKIIKVTAISAGQICYHCKKQDLK